MPMVKHLHRRANLVAWHLASRGSTQSVPAERARGFRSNAIQPCLELRLSISRNVAAAAALAVASWWVIGQPGAEAPGRALKSIGSKSTHRPPHVQLAPPNLQCVAHSSGAWLLGVISAADHSDAGQTSTSTPPDSMATVLIPALASVSASDGLAGLCADNSNIRLGVGCFKVGRDDHGLRAKRLAGCGTSETMNL